MASLAPIESVQLGERTFLQLRHAIISGEVAPGAPLRDTVLAERLAVSRTPVRDALHRLEAAGLASSGKRSGWTVTTFTEQDARELFELRRLIEPVGLRGMSGSRDPAALSEFAHAFEGYTTPIPPEQYVAYFERDSAFHRRIVRCSPNERLRGMYQVLESHIDRGRNYLVRAAEGRADETLHEHLEIITAIVAGDFGLAERRLLAHLDAGEARMIEQMRKRQTEAATVKGRE